jgi:Zn-dependent protease
MPPEISRILVEITVWAIPVLIAVTLHEAAHGFVAWRLGDDTAKMQGRVTFNPLKHVDPFGTVLLPAMLLFASSGQVMFGYARPVPVNFGRLRKPRRDMILVAASGPGINLALAVVSALLYHLVPLTSGAFQQWFAQNLENSLWINVLLCVFNMLPIPPLDGGRVAVGVLPYPLAVRLAGLERAGMLIILAAVFLLPWLGGQIGVDLNVFSWLVGRPAQHLGQFIADLTGLA